jgi:hypothetical protein
MVLYLLREGDSRLASESQFPSQAAVQQDGPARKISIFGREFRMPRSRWLRILIGAVLIVFGVFGFLPILGFWMIPVGLLVLSYEFASVRRLRRRFVVWWEKRRKRSRG